MKLIRIITFLLLVFAAACSTLKLQPADFAWPVESVLAADNNGTVSEDRYSIMFDIQGLFYEEFQDSSAYKGKEIRLLRDVNGFYFITSAGFKNVYVFKMDYGALVLDNKIFVSETGIQSPALNQRSPYIELIDNGKSLYLTNTGIYRNKK
ncbi:hypothetical protein BMS3Abin03_01970 [bacterium BMS3Abin03]|nr:hypothetical protein BMS3Abin03_01970 [bacterium BMS3Abin03]